MIAITRLLTLLALLVMPFGMAPAPAAPPGEHDAAMPMAPGHCPEKAPADHSALGFAGCAMPCASALPAEPAAFSITASTPIAAEPRIEKSPSGFELEIATPPPRPA